MNFIKNLLIFVIAVATLLLGVLFAVQNTTEAPLDLLVLSLQPRPMALWVLLAFAVGGIIGMLTNIGLVWRLRTALLRANRQLEQTAKPVAVASPEPVPGEPSNGEN